MSQQQADSSSNDKWDLSLLKGNQCHQDFFQFKDQQISHPQPLPLKAQKMKQNSKMDLSPSKNALVQQDISKISEGDQGIIQDNLEIKSDKSPVQSINSQYFRKQLLSFPKSEIHQNRNLQAIKKKNSQQNSPNLEFFQWILSLLYKCQHIPRNKSRMMTFLLNLRTGMPLKLMIDKMDKIELTITAQHYKLLSLFYEVFNELTSSEYHQFKLINFKEMLKNAYKELSLSIDFNHFKDIFLNQTPNLQASLQNSYVSFVQQMIQTTKRKLEQYTAPLIKKIKSSKKVIEKKAQNQRQQRIVSLNLNQCASFLKNQGFYYSQSSKYGIFKTKDQQRQLNECGVYKYRLDRTLRALQSKDVISPLEDLEISIQLATFIVKLTDLYVSNVIHDAKYIAGISSTKKQSKATLHQYNQLLHFSQKFYKSTQSQQFSEGQYKNNTIHQLQYPNNLKIYNNLRLFECVTENNLQSIYFPLLQEKMGLKKRRNNNEKDLNRYFQQSVHSEAIINEFQPTTVATSSAKSVSIEPKHLIYVIQKDIFFRNHQIMWRFNSLY